MSDTQLTLTIPESDNLPWFNNFIAAILYSQYSRELILNNEDILNKLKEIFNFSNDTKKNLEEIIRIADYDNPLVDSNNDKLSYLNYDNDKDKIDELNIDITFYDYLFNHEKQLTAFILPKFIEFINASCISIERYKENNYIGLYDLVEFVKKTKIEKRLFGLNQKEIKEDIIKFKDIKQRDIKKKYSEPKDYILINRWNNEVHYPEFFKEVLKMDQYGDIDGIDNKYRLSSIYKKQEDLIISDNITELIKYNDYYYKLDSFIITDNNTDKKRTNSQLITSLTYDNAKYLYSNKFCTELNELKQPEFKIHSRYPCELFKGKITISDKENISTFNLNTGSNYTLVYVKFKKIADEEREKKEAEKREKEKRDNDEKKKKADQKAKQEEERDKEAKFLRLAKLESDIEKKDDKLKKLERLLVDEYKDDISEIEKIITFTIKKEEFNELKKLLKEYINILKTADTEFKRNIFEEWIKKIYEIQDEININNKKYQSLESKQGAKNAADRLFLSFYDNIILYLNRYILFIINLVSRQNTILLLKEEIKDLPNNKKINEILDVISKLPNVEQIGKLNDLLTPTDAKITQILDVISKIPNNIIKIEGLLKPTDAKINQLLAIISKLPNEAKLNEILDAIANMPKDDKTKEILDAIAKMPKEDNKKLLEDLNAKIDAMQQDLLSKIQEQKSTNSRTIQPEIADLKEQIQLMGDIQKQLSESTKLDHTQIFDKLNSKLDDMQQVLITKLQDMEIKKSSSSNDKITLQSEIASLNQQLKLLEDIQTKISQNGDRDNKQLLQDMQQELIKYSEKDNEKIISGVQDLLRLFNKEIILKQNDKDVLVHKEIEKNIKEQLLLLKDIQTKLDENKSSDKSSDSKCINENNLLKLENSELKKQIDILKDIQSKCKKQQKEYDRCNKHNMLPYNYIKFKEDELLQAIKDHFKDMDIKQHLDKKIIDFIFNYFEKNNKVMNVYLIEKYMGDIYDVMKIFNRKYNIEDVDIKQFYRLLASISIYAKFKDVIKKIFIK